MHLLWGLDEGSIPPAPLTIDAENASEQACPEDDDIGALGRSDESSSGRQAAHNADPAVRRYSIGWLDRHVDDRILGRVDS